MKFVGSISIKAVLRPFIILLYLAALLCAAPCVAQTEETAPAPTSAEWKSATDEKTYTYGDLVEYSEVKLPVEKEISRHEPSAFERMLARFFLFLGSATGKAILISVIVLVLLYLVYRLIRGDAGSMFGRRNQRAVPAETDTEAPEDINNLDFNSRIGRHMAAGEHRLAVRYAYLWLLQTLQESGLIIYRPDKTNSAYRAELFESSQEAAFTQLARTYEYAWYGNIVPDTEATIAYINRVKAMQGATS